MPLNARVHGSKVALNRKKLNEIISTGKAVFARFLQVIFILAMSLKIPTQHLGQFAGAVLVTVIGVLLNTEFCLRTVIVNLQRRQESHAENCKQYQAEELFDFHTTKLGKKTRTLNIRCKNAPCRFLQL